MEENKILVIYIGVTGIRSEDIGVYTQRVAKKIIPATFQGEVIIIPVQSENTKIECINPKYITDINLISEHTKMMNNLQDELQKQLEILKTDLLKNKNNEQTESSN